MRERKGEIFASFAQDTGRLLCTHALVKVPLQAQAGHPSGVTYDAHGDVTYNICILLLWSMYYIVVVVCIPRVGNENGT